MPWRFDHDVVDTNRLPVLFALWLPRGRHRDREGVGHDPRPPGQRRIGRGPSEVGRRSRLVARAERAPFPGIARVTETRGEGTVVGLAPALGRHEDRSPRHRVVADARSRAAAVVLLVGGHRDPSMKARAG